jgi:hypothetical protein
MKGEWGKGNGAGSMPRGAIRMAWANCVRHGDNEWDRVKTTDSRGDARVAQAEEWDSG